MGWIGKLSHAPGEVYGRSFDQRHRRRNLAENLATAQRVTNRWAVSKSKHR